MVNAAVAAISQLVATGSIDSELTGQAQITFWRYSHYKHTAFSMENQLLQFEAGGSQTGNGQKTSLRLHRSGDLVHKLYAVIDLPGLASVANFSMAEVQDTHATHAAATSGGVGELLFEPTTSPPTSRPTRPRRARATASPSAPPAAPTWLRTTPPPSASTSFRRPRS